MVTWKNTLLALVVSFTGSLASVQAEASGVDLTVEVEFKGRILNDLDRINQIEIRREKNFRKYRSEQWRSRAPKLARARYAEAEFAVERLVPKLEEYSFETLIRRTILRDVDVMGLDEKPALIKVTLEQMRISDFSIARYRSTNSVMTGVVEAFNADGVRTGGVKLTWQMLPTYTHNNKYAGKEYVFLRESAHVRVAPLTIGFLEKALEQIYPGKDAPGPVFIWPPKGNRP